MKRMISLFLSLFMTGSAFASQLEFQFVNPSFGGNPLNGSYLLQQAQVQNKFKEERKPLFPQKSLIERFTDSFTNQLLYRMSDYILDRLFGDSGLPTEPQTYTIGNFRIEYDPTGSNYKFTITNLSTGETTTIEVPRVI